MRGVSSRRSSRLGRSSIRKRDGRLDRAEVKQTAAAQLSLLEQFYKHQLIGLHALGSEEFWRLMLRYAFQHQGSFGL